MAAYSPGLDDELDLTRDRSAGLVACKTVRVIAPAIDSKDCPLQIRPPALPSIDSDIARLTQTVCDLRFSRWAADVGIELDSVAVRDTGYALAGGRAPADPAVLTITFRDPVTPTKLARALIEFDLDQYPVLRMALAVADIDLPSAPAKAAAEKRRQALTLAVAELLVEPLFARLGKLRFDNLRVASITRGRIAQLSEGPFLHLSFWRPDTEAASFGTRLRHEHVVSLPGSAVACIDAIVKQTPVDLAFGELPQPGRMVLGVKGLSIETLERLAPGDVLLRALFPSFDARLIAENDATADTPISPDASKAHAAPCAVALWGAPGLKQLSAIVQLDGTTPVIIKEPRMSDDLDPSFADACMSIDRPDDLMVVGELELPVQFEVDTLAMPLSQLSALGPGYVIEFPVPLKDARLRLVAHGNTIGYGELVAVGEQLGVRIVRMAHGNSTSSRTDHASN